MPADCRVCKGDSLGLGHPHHEFEQSVNAKGAKNRAQDIKPASHELSYQKLGDYVSPKKWWPGPPLL